MYRIYIGIYRIDKDMPPPKKKNMFEGLAEKKYTSEKKNFGALTHLLFYTDRLVAVSASN